MNEERHPELVIKARFSHDVMIGMTEIDGEPHFLLIWHNDDGEKVTGTAIDRKDATIVLPLLAQWVADLAQEGE